jgi:glycosyltransferase involved in cell wall biosynthesis
VTIAGSNCPDSFRRFDRRSEGIRVVGFVEDHRSLLASHRVGIAPLRYGAGIKGKIGEYFSCGLPCVTTAIGAEGMELEPESNVLVGDCPQGFAESVARVYRDPALWERLSQGGIDYVRRRCSPEAITPALLRALDEARQSPPRGARTAGAMASLLAPSHAVQFAYTAVRAISMGGLRELRASLRVWLNR